jgi:hypothetical protein
MLTHELQVRVRVRYRPVHGREFGQPVHARTDLPVRNEENQVGEPTCYGDKKPKT